VSRLELDHVLIAVDDLAAAAEEVERRFGLTSVEGGRHPGWGTANRIVPLGTSYLELVAVVDAAEAAANAFGRWLAAAEGFRLLGWAVRPGDLDAVATRLGLAIGEGSRRAPGGEQLRWRSAGLESATSEPCLPFFIEWSAGTRFPGLTASPSPSIRELRVTGDAERIAGWLGPHDLPLTVLPGPPGIDALVLDGPIVLES
jgi:Glyoxalase-like domain